MEAEGASARSPSTTEGGQNETEDAAAATNMPAAPPKLRPTLEHLLDTQSMMDLILDGTEEEGDTVDGSDEVKGQSFLTATDELSSRDPSSVNVDPNAPGKSKESMDKGEGSFMGGSIAGTQNRMNEEEGMDDSKSKAETSEQKKSSKSVQVPSQPASTSTVQLSGKPSRSRMSTVPREPSLRASEDSTTAFSHDAALDKALSVDKWQYEHDQGYVALRKVYYGVQECLNEMVTQGIAVNPVIEEFGSIWEGIESSHTNEGQLLEKDREISVDLASTIAMTKNLIKLSQDDYNLANKLGKRLEKVWEQVDEGDRHEQANLNKIENLRQEIFELNRNINSAAVVAGQEKLRELQNLKTNLEAQRDTYHQEATKFRSSLNMLYAKRQELFDRKTALEEKAKLLEEEYSAQVDATERETSRKEKVALETSEIKEKIEDKLEHMNDLERSLHRNALKILDTERAVIEQRAVNDNAAHEADFSNSRIDKLRTDFEAQSKIVEKLTLNAYKEQQEIKSKEVDIFKLRVELSRVLRQRSLHMKREVALQQALASLELEREGLKAKITMLEKELQMAQKKIEEKKKKVEQLDKERSFVNRNLRRANAVSSEHASQAKTHEVAVQNLQQTLNIYKLDILEQREIIFRLEEERDYYSHEAMKLAQQVSLRLNEIKNLDLSILQYKRKLSDLETQVRKSRQIYDLALIDQEMFERTLRETMQHIVDNMTKLRVMGNTINNLKYKITALDDVIHTEALRYDRMVKETNFFRTESERLRRMAEDVQRQNDALSMERSTLGCFKAEMEGELSKTQKYLSTSMSRDRLFQIKLMEQENEIKASWEKMRILESVIRIGAANWRGVMGAICCSRRRILNIRKAQSGKSKVGRNYTRLVREYNDLKSHIAQEQCMIASLEMQMKHPINVHRWRILEAVNPAAYEMVLKINLLTRRVVQRNSNLAELSQHLREKQNMYVEARKAMERSPGLELPEDIVYYQHLLASKKHQYMALQRELLASESQISFFRGEVKLLNDKMLDLRDEFFRKLKKMREKTPDVYRRRLRKWSKKGAERSAKTKKSFACVTYT